MCKARTAHGWARRHFLFGGLAITSLCAVRARADQPPRDWTAVLKSAQGQTVHFNAWGGDQRINDYIAWAGGEVAEAYGITIEHVKLADTADAVARIIAEKAAGVEDNG